MCDPHTDEEVFVCDAECSTEICFEYRDACLLCALRTECRWRNLDVGIIGSLRLRFNGKRELTSRVIGDFRPLRMLSGGKCVCLADDD